MAKNQLSFFATKTDLELLLQKIEAKQPLSFIAAGLFDSPAIEPKQSLQNIPGLGVAVNGDPNHNPRFLISDGSLPFEIRKVQQHRGEIKYAVDQQANPKTIVFQSGGTFGEKCLVAGQVGTASDDASSLKLFQLFSKEIRQQFTKIKSYYVGKEAAGFLDKGWRLTSNAKSPALYDLKRK